jgi:hypothetical protein
MQLLHIIALLGFLNRVTGLDFYNRLTKVEKEKLLAEQECRNLRTALEQGRDKVGNNHVLLGLFPLLFCHMCLYTLC